jgi:hypothetical protein
LFVIECEPPRDDPANTGWRAVVVCHGCFHKIDPDMWINKAIWDSINPVTPFERLPKAMFDGDNEGEERWDPETYVEVPQ